MSPDPQPAAWGHVTFISAGAGSGKTYRLTEELENALVAGAISPAGIVGTTFTVKAANELRERVRDRLIAAGRLDLAERTAESLVGTVHSVCERLLKRFAFELSLSPQLNVMSIDDGTRFFNQAVDHVLAIDRVRELNGLARRLGMVDRGMPSWQTVVKDIADKARENDIGAAALRAMGGRNADAFLAFFPQPMDADPTAELATRVHETRRDMPNNGMVGTEKYRAMLADAEPFLQRPDCPWQFWMRLAGTSGLRAIHEHVAHIQEAAGLYERHPGFHRDLRDFLTGIFEVAADSLAHFDTVKREHGLIDFTDMEQMTLHALDQDAVRERLRDEIELLLVDEFQDTNPMQLALFVKLAALADRAIFVGDVKQAIYEFRGCDPTLVFNTLAGLTAGAAATDQLNASWRARPALVHYVNELFDAAFHDIPRAAVVLHAQREEISPPAVTSWALTDATLTARTLAVADGVARLVAEGAPVVDPATGKTRPISFGDIAVLARTNIRVEAIAKALRAMRTPMKMTLLGLLDTPEVTLAKSCLRRLADRADTLATAEIVVLGDCEDPESWLAGRLDWLAGGGKSIAWLEDDHPIIARLRDMRAKSALRSPVETVARVLNEVDIRRIVAAWGPDDVRAAQRQKNLDAFLNLAVEYEKHAAAHHEPGTLTGFLFWLEHPSSPDLDLQPVITSGDAVHVLTYHRAKGLEWPVVVCTDFDYEERLRTWDVRVELNDDFRLDAPLANRELRYWPNIFGKRKNGVPARAAIEDSAEGKRCRAKTLAEQRRLAYVGMTRARDRLVLALPTRKPHVDAWYHSFVKDFAVPKGDQLTLPNEVTIPTKSEVIEALEEAREPRPYQPRWFERRERPTYPREILAPSSITASNGATVAQIIEIGERINLRSDDMADVGNGLHAVIAAELVNPLSKAASRKRAQDLLSNHGVGNLRAEDAVAATRRLRRYLERRLKVGRFEVEVPVSHRRQDGRVVKGFVDLLAETPDGWLVIDHKSSPQARSAWPDEALQHAGQLGAYRDALVAAGRNVAGCYVHLAVTGTLVRIDIAEAGCHSAGHRPKEEFA